MVFGSRHSSQNDESEAEVPSEDQSSDSEELDESDNPDDGDDGDEASRARRSSRLRQHRQRFSRRESSNMRVTRNSLRQREQNQIANTRETRLLARRSRADNEEDDDFETHFIDEIQHHTTRRVRNPNYDGSENTSLHQTVRRRGRPPNRPETV